VIRGGSVSDGGQTDRMAMVMARAGRGGATTGLPIAPIRRYLLASFPHGGRAAWARRLRAIVGACWRRRSSPRRTKSSSSGCGRRADEQGTAAAKGAIGRPTTIPIHRVIDAAAVAARVERSSVGGAA
jgi:hypothetical protein